VAAGTAPSSRGITTDWQVRLVHRSQQGERYRLVPGVLALFGRSAMGMEQGPAKRLIGFKDGDAAPAIAVLFGCTSRWRSDLAMDAAPNARAMPRKFLCYRSDQARSDWTWRPNLLGAHGVASWQIRERDDIGCAALKQRRVHDLGVASSGRVLERGHCSMIGGQQQILTP
jgi:hypothetical protein